MSTLSLRAFPLVLLFGCLLGCAAARSETTSSLPAEETVAALPEAWRPLASRLSADGLYTPKVEAALLQSGAAPSPDPMGRKIRELYTSAFLRPRPDPAKRQPAARPSRPAVYPGVVTAANAALCRDFLKENRKAFETAEKRYGVPREIAVSLLFVETRLGTFLGKENAFLTLASMAASTEPQSISAYLDKLPDSSAADRQTWIRERMSQRSDWAYKELAAFIRHTRDNGLDPLGIPGSIYGAVGLCQFMPSNLAPYAVDGDDDGIVDLFVPADAIASLSQYLVKHGWKPGISRAKRHAVLRSYNHADIYANTILALAAEVAKPAPAATTGKKS